MRMIIKNLDYIDSILVGTTRRKENNMKTNLINMNPVLFVVDMVNGFCKEGAMADQNIMHIVKPIQDLCEKVVPENRYFIADTHNVDDIEFSAFPQHLSLIHI